jgi:hypothetical protein
VADAAAAVNLSNEKLFPRRGEPIRYSVNGSSRVLRGHPGEAAVITVNNKAAHITLPIVQHDIIEITESTFGDAASADVGHIPEYAAKEITFIVNSKKVVCPRFVTANGELVSEFYNVKDGDALIFINYYTVEQVFGFLDMLLPEDIYVNNEPATPDTKVYDNFSIKYGEEAQELKWKLKSEQQSESAGDEDDFADTDNDADGDMWIADQVRNDSLAGGGEQADVPDKNGIESANASKSVMLTVLVNNRPVLLEGRAEYMLVDVFDKVDFDPKKPQGNKVVLKLNGQETDFLSNLHDRDKIDLYWDD